MNRRRRKSRKRSRWYSLLLLLPMLDAGPLLPGNKRDQKREEVKRMQPTFQKQPPTTPIPAKRISLKAWIGRLLKIKRWTQ